MKKIVLLLLTFNLLLFANVAKIVAMNGEATVLRDNNTITLAVGNELLKDDVIQTKENTKIQIIFKDETIVTIGKNSEFKINDYIFDEANQQYSANLGLVQGTFRTITGKIGKVAPEKFKLNSKSSSIGIRGTQILSNVQIQGDTIFCTEGEIEIVSQLTGETITLQAGQFVQIREGEPAVVQEFDAQTINTTDTNTKFLNDEEKEEALENFGVTINQVDPIAVETQEETNNQDNQTQINQTTSNINDTSTYDDLEEIAQDNSSSNTMQTYSVLMGESGSDFFSSSVLNSGTDGKMLFESGTSRRLNFQLDNILSKYSNDGSYTGTLSTIGTQSIQGFNPISFISGSYESVKDSEDGQMNLVFDTNDDIQWGTWNVSFEDSDNEEFSLNGYWLIGNQTAASEVQKLISDGTSANYSGHALGKTTMGTSFDASDSSVTFNINFGAQTLTGNFSLANESYDEDVSGTLTSSGFTFTPDSGSGSGNGSFYGSNANSVGGNFNLTGGGYTYSGVFKAKKQ
ncbi:MAG: hypothetical protein CVU67_00195 [Deltaproteobacteria bacterium HGW-Deltaproteobacteria-24]|nr:MAG: hypothetical protein CVU67_00195 [Deltaproteobacteria bacterium HGW-Deltaproteobacteria-24]